MAASDKNYTGTCTMCGKKDCELTIVDEVEHVCEECLGNEYIFCDECKQYWLWDAICFYNLKDGRTLCEHCGEDIPEELVESIDDWT
jgi:hypothetical protein